MIEGSEEISGSEDLITSTQVDNRISYIEYWDCGEETPCDDDDCPRHGNTGEELQALKELASALSADSFETLLSEGYFPKYVQEDREDQGGIPEDMRPYIDWKMYAEDQRADCTSVTYHGFTFYAQ